MVLPHSHATQVTDGLEKARGMAETTRLPRVSLGGRLKDVSQGTTERLQPSCPRILRGDVAWWLCTRLSAHPLGCPRCHRQQLQQGSEWALRGSPGRFSELESREPALGARWRDKTLKHQGSSFASAQIGIRAPKLQWASQSRGCRAAEMPQCIFPAPQQLLQGSL